MCALLHVAGCSLAVDVVLVFVGHRRLLLCTTVRCVLFAVCCILSGVVTVLCKLVGVWCLWSDALCVGCCACGVLLDVGCCQVFVIVC